MKMGPEKKGKLKLKAHSDGGMSCHHHRENLFSCSSLPH
tara:strand:+ start:564 stop:680 length:117 start_codon:yes stop_codon:yes gene_type:complete